MTADLDAMMAGREQAWLLVEKWLPEIAHDEQAKKRTIAFLTAVLSAAEASYQATLTALLFDLEGQKVVERLAPYCAPDQPFMRDFLELVKIRALAAKAQTRYDMGDEPETPAPPGDPDEPADPQDPQKG